MSYGHGPLGQTLLEHNLLDEIFWSTVTRASPSPFSEKGSSICSALRCTPYL